jgi:hypothetical protein
MLHTVAFGKWILLATVALVFAGTLTISVGFSQAQSNSGAQVQTGGQGQNSAAKTVISGGKDMGTYIDAVQANFGNPNIIVTLPTMDAGKL